MVSNVDGADISIGSDLDPFKQEYTDFDESDFANYLVPTTPGSDSNEYVSDTSSPKDSSSNTSVDEVFNPPNAHAISPRQHGNISLTKAFPNGDCLTMDSQTEIAAVKPDMHQAEPQIVDEFHQDVIMDPSFNPYNDDGWSSVFPSDVHMQDGCDVDLDQGSDSGFSMNDSARSSPSPSSSHTPLPSRGMSQQRSPVSCDSSNLVTPNSALQSSSDISCRSTSEESRANVSGGSLYLAPSLGLDNKAKRKTGRKRKSENTKLEHEDSYTELLERASQQNKKQKPHTIPIENPNAAPQITWADKDLEQPFLALPLPFSDGDPIPSRPPLFLHPVCQTSHPIKTRVETQIPLRLYISDLPSLEVTKCHFAPHTVSRPKGLLKIPWVPSPDTLDLDARLVTESAWRKSPSWLLQEAYRDSCKKPQKVNPNLPLRRYRVGQDSQEENNDRGPTVREFSLSDPQNPLNGGPVWICAGCMDRENKRSDRKKSKKPEEEMQWYDMQGYRIVMLTNKEVMEWAPIPGGPRPEPSAKGTFSWHYMLDTQMRIVCYCRHHHEKSGYRVIFTLKDHKGNLVAQGLTDLISVTDDHKAEKDKDYANNQLQKKRKRNPNSHSPEPKLPAGRSQLELSPRRETTSRRNLQTTEQVPSSPPFDQEHLHQASEQSSQTQHSLQDQTNSLGLGQASSYTSGGRLTPIPPTPTSNHHRSPPPSMPTPALTPQHSLHSSLSPELGSTDIPFGSPDFAFSFQAPSFPTISNLHNVSSVLPPANHLTSNMISPMPAHAVLQPQTYRNRVLPQVHTIIPGEGPTSGGIEICIRGANFTPTTQIMFGNSLASTKTFINDNYLIVILPMGRAGEVAVYNPDNARFHGNLNDFAMFKYVDDAEKQIMELALAILGNKLTGQGVSPVDLARMILQRDPHNGGGQDQGHSQLNGTTMEYRIMAAMSAIDEQQTQHPWKLDMKNHVGLTLLHLASSMGMQKLARDLLKRGANPNLRDIHGNTPLHYAALNSHEEVLAHLLLNGADPTYLNARGASPLKLASSDEIRTTLRNFLRPRPHSEETFSEFDESAPASPSDARPGTASYVTSRRTSVISNNATGQFASMNDILVSRPSTSQSPASSGSAADAEKQPAKTYYFPYANVRDMINNSFQGVRERVPTFSAASIASPTVPTYQQLLEMYNQFPNAQQLWQRFGRAASETDISAPPPSYREVCPEDELTRDEKSALDGLLAVQELPSRPETTPLTSAAPASSSTGVEIIEKESKEELVLRRGQQQVIVSGKIGKINQMRQIVERASPQNNPDRMLYIFWIPLLVVVLILMLWNMTQTGGGDVRLLLQLAKKTGTRLFQFVRERYREETLNAGVF